MHLQRASLKLIDTYCNWLLGVLDSFIILGLFPECLKQCTGLDRETMFLARAVLFELPTDTEAISGPGFYQCLVCKGP